MHYSNGNYEAFVKADKPKDVDQKSAYIVEDYYIQFELKY